MGPLGRGKRLPVEELLAGAEAAPPPNGPGPAPRPLPALGIGLWANVLFYQGCVALILATVIAPCAVPIGGIIGAASLGGLGIAGNVAGALLGGGLPLLLFLPLVGIWRRTKRTFQQGTPVVAVVVGNYEIPTDAGEEPRARYAFRAGGKIHHGTCYAGSTPFPVGKALWVVTEPDDASVSFHWPS